MNRKKLIVGLDVGTTKVCTLVAHQNEDSSLEILGIGNQPSHGLRKGSVVNIEKTIESIKKSVDDARLMAGMEFDSATVGIAGGHIYSFNSSGVVPIKGEEVTLEDIHKVIEAAKAVVLPSDREILHVIPREFKVDNVPGIKDPIGMCGIRLEANVHVVTGQISLIQNLIKCVEMTGITANQITLQPIASSEAVLTIEEKELGVILVDIGGGTTDIAIWREGSLAHSQIIPIGGNHFTNDLALALKIPFHEAEKLKINSGSVLKDEQNKNSKVKIQGLSGTAPREVELKMVSDILGARAEELFKLIKKVAEDSHSLNKIAGGIVLTGGGSMIKGLSALSEFLLDFPTKVGYPIPFGGITKSMESPQYATVMGLLQLAKKRVAKTPERHKFFSGHGHFIGKIKESLKSVIKEIF
ncbi:MAG: cell division protein FtsA [Epsilonproteobacteria bacterium]|nr:MAG: cell division protein FtsA [Campylobacterota bacterium]RLA66830.1 MAG: cell division protein FtsA [Campylobacterota bacterium]